MKNPESAERVQVGRVIGLWGVQGWLRVYSDTQPPDAIFSYQPWLLGPDEQAFQVQDWRRQGPRLMARLSGLSDPDEAARLIDAPIRVPRSILPRPEEGRFYWADLVGLEVSNLQGHSYGTVQRLIETGANDVLDIRTESGQSILIPFVTRQIVKDVDLRERRIVVDWPLEWTQ
jgi:16S rRNA processing protein RimM